MHLALRRLSVIFLAFLPVVWGNCPYWFVGTPGSAGKGSVGSGSGAETSREPTCPCCRKKARAGASRESTSPFDCGDCPMLVARHGSMPAPAALQLPATDEGGVLFSAALPPATLDVALAVACARAATGPPAGPPGTIVSRLLDEVSLRI